MSDRKNKHEDISGSSSSSSYSNQNNRPTQAAGSSSNMPTSHYNRVRVQDLLNTETPSSSRRNRSSSDSDEAQRNSNYQCQVANCNRVFSTAESLAAHVKRSHAAPTQFVCEHCGSSFSTPPNLNKHVRFYNIFSSQILLFTDH